MSLTPKTPSIIGGILLVIGNVIGAGILALPIATAQLGLFGAILLLIAFWGLMTLGANYFLEANLACPSGANLISMSRPTLGKWGVLFTWLCNLLVMYSLIAAYIAGGGDLVHINLAYLGISLSPGLSALVFVILFGCIVSRGIHLTDHANRILMVSKAVIFIAMIIGLISSIHTEVISYFPHGEMSASLLIVAITSYGFAVIIPSLRTYYHNDVKKIKRIIWFGTGIPLLCYLVWVTVIFSIVPYKGHLGLHAMALSKTPVADLQLALSQALHKPWITQATNIFSAICIITSFFANSISFSDFMADGLQLSPEKKGHWIVYLIVFLPALCAVIFYPRAFLLGLSIAGTLAIIQLLILPALFVWRLRYSTVSSGLSYSVKGGKPLLLIFLSISLALLVFTLFF